MKFSSTRNAQCRVDAAQAIVQGISPEGGLFVRESRVSIRNEELLCSAYGGTKFKTSGFAGHQNSSF